jgi:ribonuclease HII
VAGILLPTLDQELSLWQRGFGRLAGLDEAGRGAWAGPVVAAAVVLPADPTRLLRTLSGVRDSKTLAPTQREALHGRIVEVALGVGVGVVPPAQVDALGIVPATCAAMHQAVAELLPAPDYLLIDYLRLNDLPLPQHSLAKGDAHVLSIAAASIVAKVHRDRLMVALEADFPGYGFASHKGYGTPQHRAALWERGITPLHRRSFEPVRLVLEASGASPSAAEPPGDVDTLTQS